MVLIEAEQQARLPLEGKLAESKILTDEVATSGLI